MEINRSCETCEFNFDGVCADVKYGKKITDLKKQRKCWSIGFEYHNELVDMLPEDLRNDYLHNFSSKFTIEKIMEFLESENEINESVYKKMQNYITEIEDILKMCNRENKKTINERYKTLKSKMKNEERFWNTSRNAFYTTDFIKHIYIPSILEASINGLEAKTNGQIEDIQNSLIEAEDFLTKYKSKEEWFGFK